jgi:hypothetical protein
MIVCRLCGLTLEAIPADAVLIGKLYRFVDGSYHFLRKKLAPRTGPRPRKSTNPDREAPVIACEPKSEEVPTPEVTLIPANENAMQRAFRLKKVA